MKSLSEKIAVEIPETVWMFLMWGLFFLFSIGIIFPLAFGLLPVLFGMLSMLILYCVARYQITVNRFLLAWALTFVALCLASSFWAYNQEETLSRAVKVGGLILGSIPFLFILKDMPDRIRKIFMHWFPFILVLISSIIAIELYFDFPFYRSLQNLEGQNLPSHILNKNVGVLIMLLPFGLMFAADDRRYKLMGLLLALTLIILAKTQSQAAQLGFFVMILAYAIHRFIPHYFRNFVLGITVFLLISMPFIVPYAFNSFAEKIQESGRIAQESSAAIRLEVYDFISKRIMEQPAIGFGMDSTRYMTFDSEQKYWPGNQIMHPHNMALQLWLEFGVLGILCFVVLTVFLFRITQRISQRDQTLFMMVFCVSIVFLMISWSIWASWFVGLIFCLAGLCLLAREPENSLRIT